VPNLKLDNILLAVAEWIGARPVAGDRRKLNLAGRSRWRRRIELGQGECQIPMQLARPADIASAILVMLPGQENALLAPDERATTVILVHEHAQGLTGDRMAMAKLAS